MASSYKLKLDKRTKEEDEAHARVRAAEEAYVLQLKVTNASLQVRPSASSPAWGWRDRPGLGLIRQARVGVGGRTGIQDLKRFTLLTQRALDSLVHGSDAKYKVRLGRLVWF